MCFFDGFVKLNLSVVMDSYISCCGSLNEEYMSSVTRTVSHILLLYKGKAKVIPLQVRCGPEGG